MTLLADAGRLVVDVTAEVPVEDYDLDPGIIHPFAAVWGTEAIVVSGRAIRAEERLHLADTKARASAMARKVPKPGQRGSRCWRNLRRAQRHAEARHRRRVRQAHHEAARSLVDWALAHRIGTLVVGDPKGITKNAAGEVHNRRIAITWPWLRWPDHRATCVGAARGRLVSAWCPGVLRSSLTPSSSSSSPGSLDLQAVRTVARS